MQIEVWKDIIGFEGKYQISNKGRVKSLSRIYAGRKTPSNEIIRKLVFDTDGYLMVSFPVENRKLISPKVHQLVAKHFKDNFKQGCQVCHKDGNKLNNDESNLYVGNTITNTLDKYKQNRTKVSLSQIEEIKNATGFHKEIAKRYGVAQSFITRIKNGTRGKGLYYSNLIEH